MSQLEKLRLGGAAALTGAGGANMNSSGTTTSGGTTALTSMRTKGRDEIIRSSAAEATLKDQNSKEMNAPSSSTSDEDDLEALKKKASHLHFYDQKKGAGARLLVPEGEGESLEMNLPK
ncbi:unnamed protein product, partial [Amoebophrya sp. A25]|eukprot:GSA25T00016376001.1